MDRHCIICGEVPTSSYTYPNSMEEALKWQTLLTIYVPAEALQDHCCVCNKHIDNSQTQHKQTQSKHNDLSEQRFSVSFKKSDAIHYFGENPATSAATWDSNNSQSLGSQGGVPKGHLQRKDGCTQLCRPLWEPSAVFERDIANSADSFVTSKDIERRNISAFDSGFSSRISDSVNNTIHRGRDGMRGFGYTTGSTCICEPSCPQIDLNNMRIQQGQQKCAAADPKQMFPSSESPLNETYSSGTHSRNANQRLAHQQKQHQECQCCLNAVTCDQVMQCPSQELKQTPKIATSPNSFCDLNSNTTLCSNFYDRINVQSDQTDSSLTSSWTFARQTANKCPNNQFKQAPINVLVLSGSMLPSYYTNPDNRQSMPTEICVLESDLAHEGAKLPDIDVPKYTVCRAAQRIDGNGRGIKENVSSTEVLLMSKAPSNECTNQANGSRRPSNSENESKDPLADLNCNELIRNQETRMQELERLLNQQQQLQLSIQAKLNELQSTASA